MAAIEYDSESDEYKATAIAEYANGVKYEVKISSGFIEILKDGEKIADLETIELEENPIKNW